jgi:uncharacterized protein YeaO (DUF488 family)
MLTIYTIQIAKWRLAKAKQIRITDTTVTSGLGFLAPSWEMVLGHKNGGMSCEQYTKLYDECIQRSQTHHPEQWGDLLKPETLCLACYCRAGFFCHRLLLAKHLQAYAEKQGVFCTLAGELVD